MIRSVQLIRVSSLLKTYIEFSYVANYTAVIKIYWFVI